MVNYLKYLFIYYNRQISDDEFDKAISSEWGWAKLFKNMNDNLNIDSVTIITYNYDIILERLLRKMSIAYEMVGFENKTCKFHLIKPHGSISFRSKREYDKDSFSIKYNRDSLGGKIEDLIVDEEVDFDKISNINTMIPPAGESGRYKLVWSNVLKGKSLEAVKKLNDDDDIFFGGISYCNVDRQELDEIITSLNPNVNVRINNPDTKNTFGSVISSVFDNYIHYSNSSILGGLYID